MKTDELQGMEVLTELALPPGHMPRSCRDVTRPNVDRRAAQLRRESGQRAKNKYYKKVTQDAKLSWQHTDAACGRVGPGLPVIARPGPARPPVPPSSYLARLHHLLECSAAAATGAADDGPLAANVKTQLIMLAEEPASQPARLIISTGSRLV